MSNKKSSTSFLVQGSILAMASIISRIIGLVYRIPLTAIIGNKGNDYYGCAFEIYNILLIISSYSLPLAVSKLVSADMSLGRKKNVYRILKCALIFGLVSGTIAALILFFGAEFITGTIMKTPYSIFAVKVLVPTLIVVAVLGVMRGFFQGLGTMMPSATSQILEQIANAIVSVWAAYVLADYGTGAIMCVPAHDDRDFEFATKFNIPIIQVIAKDGKIIENMTEAYTEASGTMVNSGEWDGMESAVLKKEAPHIIEERGIGRATVNFKLRDWVFSRQRYWGEPIPIVHCPDCGCVPVPEDQLPLRLPDVESYEPTGTGESPLAGIESWVNTTCPVCGKPAKRETNTMPQWAGSSWYFLRYVDNHNNEELVSKEKADKMLPVDMYIGGVEHAVLHLLYSRFYTKFLYDIGVVDFDEPFTKLFNQGMITGKNGIKMSKSKGNVVSPDDLVRDYGCDALRMYEMFVGPPELDAEWDDRGIDGVYRFLKKLWNLVMDSKDKDIQPTKDMVKIRHKVVHDVTKRLESFSLNTVISAFMENTNKMAEMAKKEGGMDKETLKTVAILIAPFAPHIAEEIWEELGGTGSVFHAGWPKYDLEEMQDDEIEVPVQINGKTKVVIKISADATKEEAIAAGKEAIADKLTGTIVKEIYVPKKIINIVMK